MERLWWLNRESPGFIHGERQESARKFYEDPENVKAFEKWKREQNQKKGKAPRK